MTQNSKSNTYCSLPDREGGGRVFLSLTNASITFGNRPLFTGLDLAVDPGRLIGISGESGCGKTSLLRALLGFVPLEAEGAFLFGMPLDAAHIDLIRQRTAYVPQELQPIADTGRDLLRLTLDLERNRPLQRAPLSSLLSSLALDPSLLEQSAAKLSGGQRQRLLIAAALALPKPLLLLDEPTSALDEDSTQRVALALLRACHEENRAALVVSHDPILLSFCDQVISLP
ncbi:MAG: ATP-binding cassette domain-containing protein [Bacteroidaceae bacterium]|nr:ATP-binding cassette domain-containing protein [Bacteroidaceae bacterium]